jgi:hypothetical protein
MEYCILFPKEGPQLYEHKILPVEPGYILPQPAALLGTLELWLVSIPNRSSQKKIHGCGNLSLWQTWILIVTSLASVTLSLSGGKFLETPTGESGIHRKLSWNYKYPQNQFSLKNLPHFSVFSQGILVIKLSISIWW